MSDSDVNRRRILLVEDEAVVALSEKRTIQAHGFNVTVAHSGEAAIDAALGDARPDLILMDIDLGSGIDGTEAAQRILSELSLPIVFLTSHTEKDYVDRVRDITNYGYVIKHSGEFVLIESIRMALELFNAHREIATSEARLRRSHWERDSIVRLTQELIVRLDQSGRWTFVNDRACEFFGKTREELLGQHFMDYVHPEDITTVREEDRQISRSHQSVVGSVNRQKTTRGWRTVRWNSAPILDEHGNYLGHQSTGRDITEEVQATRQLESQNAAQQRRDEELTRERHRLATIIEATNVGTWEWNAETGETRLNEQWASMLGYTLEELSPISIQTWRDLAHPEDLQHSDRRLAEHFRGESDTYRSVVRVRHKEGHWVWILDSGSVVERTEEGNPLWVYGTHQDITEQKQLQASVEQTNRELSLILDSSPLLIFYKDEEGRHVFVNAALATSVGVSKQQVIGKRPSEIFSPEHGAVMEKHDRQVLTTGRPELGVEEAYTSNGSVRWAKTSRVPVQDENGRTIGLVGFVEDITERKRAEEELRQREKDFSSLVENASDMICRFDTELRHVYCNKAVSRETGQPLETFLGKTPLDSGGPANVGRSLHDALMAAYRSGREQRITQALTVGSSGTETTRWFDVRIVPELDEEGNIESLLSIGRDVTDRKNTEAALQRAVEERDTLMQELNHRVKNNLAIVKSLIGLKDAELGPEIDLTDIRNQVEAIRTVHEKLNTGNGASHIEMRAYLHDLLETIFASVSRDRLTITNEVEELRLPSKLAVPVSLVVNELATNALKHGLTGTAREEFTVTLNHDERDGWYTLTVSNTGAPLPDSIDLDNPTTLGLRLVGALVTQINGHMELRRHPHPEFTIRWPVS